MAMLPFPATIKSNGISFLIDFMGWVAKAAAPRRRRSNPEGTYNNKVGHVAIFLKAFGVSVLAASTAVRFRWPVDRLVCHQAGVS
jgi:hypothetical protein